METPTSTRRMTRSQTKAAFSNNTNISSKKIEESENGGEKKTKQRTCLIDITNDSPIVGLASAKLNGTPISSIVKQKRSNRCKKTPGSGEALLRGQVKNLLQKVEEEAEISKFLSFGTGCGRHGLKAFLNSPAGLLAPTPANTPLVLNFSSALDEFESLGSVLESPIEDQLTVSKVVSGTIDGMQQAGNGSECERDIISRSLFLDFSDKSDCASDCSSVVTFQGTGEAIESSSKEKSPSKDEEDDASIWSIQVNVSTRDEDEDEDEEVVEDDELEVAEDYFFEEDGEVEESGLESDNVPELDELCEGIMNIAVSEGKHIRFVYNSDDELVEEEVSGEALRLKGLPTPKGKHLRFQDEDDE